MENKVKTIGITGAIVVLALLGLLYKAVNRPVVVNVAPADISVASPVSPLGAIQDTSVCSSLAGKVDINDRVYLDYGNSNGTSTFSFASGSSEDMTLLMQTVATGTNNPQIVTITPYLSFDESVYYQGAIDWANTVVATNTLSFVALPNYQVVVGVGTTSSAVHLSHLNAPFAQLVFELGTSTSNTSAGAINVKVCKR